MTEPQGTFACPICAWPTPHAHGTEDVGMRPEIDGARAAFEVAAREFMLRRDFTHVRVGFMWAFEGELARLEGEWAARNFPTGPYHNDLVQRTWELWALAWMAARGR